MAKYYPGSQNAMQKALLSHLVLPYSEDTTHKVSFRISSCCSCLWDHWQPAVNYSSLQVSVTYVRVWQHRIKVLHLFYKPLAVLFFTDFVHPSALPFLVSLLPTFLSKNHFFSLESHPIAVLHVGPSWRSLKEKCPEHRVLPCSPMRPSTSCYCSETLGYPVPPELREGVGEGSFQWEMCGKEEREDCITTRKVFSAAYTQWQYRESGTSYSQT